LTTAGFDPTNLGHQTPPQVAIDIPVRRLKYGWLDG
jgi:hypothetical protein